MTSLDTCIQDRYAEDFRHCFGCGSLNAHGHHIQSYWDGKTCACVFQPKPHHTAIPGYVYGGLLASLIDCHGIATASAIAADQGDRHNTPAPGLREVPLPRYVTASLQVKYVRPTPMGEALHLTARPLEMGARKIKVSVELTAGGQVCATGLVIAAPLPESMATGQRRG